MDIDISNCRFDGLRYAFAHVTRGVQAAQRRREHFLNHCGIQAHERKGNAGRLVPPCPPTRPDGLLPGGSPRTPARRPPTRPARRLAPGP